MAGRALSEMPEDNAALANVVVEFPPLAPDDVSACPESLPNILEYLGREVPEGSRLVESDLTFIRTALVGGAEYWIWRFREPGPDGDDAYVTVSRRHAQVTVGYATNYYGLSAEQFMLGDFHNAF